MSGRIRALVVAVALIGVGCDSGFRANGTLTTSGLASATSSTSPITLWSVAYRVENENEAVADAIPVGDRLVAVGTTGSAPMILTSSDGSSWDRLPADPGLVSKGGAGMRSAIAWRGRLLAIGPGDGQSVVWQSTDGRSWTLAYQSEPGTDAAPGAMNALTASDAELVATGVTSPGLIDDFGGASWYSTDGTTWSVGGPSIGLLRAPMWDVTWANGLFVAVGGVRGAVSWTSSDGANWTMHDQVDTVSAGQFWSVMQGDKGFVAVGGELGAGFSAVSSDGAAWTRGPCTGALTDAQLYAVARTQSGYVAGGTVRGHAAIWLSPDGLTWSRVRASLGDGEVRQLLPRDDALIALGSSIWVGPANGYGDEGLYPEAPCGAPVPDATGAAESTSGSGETGGTQTPAVPVPAGTAAPAVPPVPAEPEQPPVPAGTPGG